MKTLLQILFLCLTATVYGQGQKTSIERLVKKIAEENNLNHKNVSFAGTTTDQYHTFLKLRDKATTATLISLLDHNNSVVKGYASWALADNKYPGLASILFKFLESRETVPTFNGCIISRDELAAEFYYRVVYQHFENDVSVDDSVFFSEQIKKLDSVIIYHFESSSLLRTALSHNKANPAHYDRIKQLALKNKDPQAIIELAKYNKSTDIDALKKLGKRSLLAISYFPDESFWPFLENYFEKDKSPELFMAVASFKNAKANQTLSTFFTALANAGNKELVEKLDEALITHYSPHYQDLLLLIWEKYKFIDIAATRSLIADNPQKASAGFAKGLLNSNPFRFIVVNDEYEFKDSILPLILHTVARYDSDKLPDICSINIKNTDFTDLEIFLKFVRENKIGGLESVLLAKLDQQGIPFDMYALTETILAYNNPDLKQQAVEILKANRSWDIGNWSEAFRELFKTHHIRL